MMKRQTDSVDVTTYQGLVARDLLRVAGLALAGKHCRLGRAYVADAVILLTDGAEKPVVFTLGRK